MQLQSPEVKADLTARLRRIEGQVRGVQKMVEDERDCSEILQQMAAIRSAIHQASLVLARAYAARCLLEPGRGDVDAMLDQLMTTLRKLD
ncbi:MAG: metal-sensitive transcriptional regulator [Anaerolineae bacterium]|nr:metal-sensitive transcriptional regulator [Anaerolineae bacterium]